MLPTTLSELLASKIRRVARELGKADVRKLPLFVGHLKVTLDFRGRHFECECEKKSTRICAISYNSLNRPETMRNNQNVTQQNSWDSYSGLAYTRVLWRQVHRTNGCFIKSRHRKLLSNFISGQHLLRLYYRKEESWKKSTLHMSGYFHS